MSLFLLVEFVVHADADERGVAAGDVKAQADEVEELTSHIEEHAAELAEVEDKPGSTAHA